jgi:hypothetical protein
VFDSGQDNATDQNLATSIALTFGLARPREEPNLLGAQTRKALIERLNPSPDSFGLRHRRIVRLVFLGAVSCVRVASS